jgi:hypothetical protein
MNRNCEEVYHDFFLTSCCFIHLRSKYSPQHPALKHSQCMLFRYFERPSFTPIQNYRRNYWFLCFILYGYRQQARRQKIAKWIQTSALVRGEWSASRPVRLTPGERVPGTHCTGGWVGPRAGLDDVDKWKFLPPPGLELRPIGRPARSQSLYRLSYRYRS